MSYQLNRSHLLICIFAGLVFTIGFVWRIFFSHPNTLFTMAMWVSLAIVVFYIIGHFVRAFLINNVFVSALDDYDFENDPEYQAYMSGDSGLEQEMLAPMDVMYDEPLNADTNIENFDDDPFMEPIPLDAS